MSLQQLINEQLRKEYEAEKHERYKFSPSLFGRCFRIQILNRGNVPPSNPPDDRVLRIFKSGKLFHDFIQGFIPNHQIEVPCETDEIKGRADVVSDDSVYDIKSVHSGSFWYANKPDYDIKMEKFHNWLQLAYYAWVLKKEKIVLVQISKDDLCINEYADFTNNWLESLQIEIEQLRFYWKQYEKSGDLPNAEPRFNAEGKYCNYKDYCKGVEDGDSRDITKHACHSCVKSRTGRKPTASVATK